MDERGLGHNAAIQASLELLGEGELPQARDVLFREVATSEVAAAWGLLSVLATDQAEAERCLEQVSRLLFLDHRGSEAPEGGSSAAGSKAGHRLDALVGRSARPSAAGQPPARAIPYAARAPAPERRPAQAAPGMARPSGGRLVSRRRVVADGSLTTPSRGLTIATMLMRLPRLAGAALSGLLVLAMVGVIALLLAPRLVGAHLLVVQSQSMEPLVPMGALVVSLPMPPSEIAVGDVVTYKSHEPSGGNDYVTHRVVERIGSETDLRFVTKGDASEAEDLDPVPPAAIVGRAALIVPLVGFLIVGIRTPPGFLTLIGVPALMLLVGEVREIVSMLRARARRMKGVVT